MKRVLLAYLLLLCCQAVMACPVSWRMNDLSFNAGYLYGLSPGYTFLIEKERLYYMRNRHYNAVGL